LFAKKGLLDLGDLAVLLLECIVHLFGLIESHLSKEKEQGEKSW
jgi:hypothetical protein